MPIDYTKRPSPAATAETGAPGGGVSLTKVTLTKAAPTVSLTKQGSATGVLRVNLNWNSGPASTGLFRRAASSSIDLDLGCLYEFADGSKGVVQALGNAFTAAPRGARESVIWLDGDDRTGAVSGGENLYINLAHLNQIRRVMVFALIYQGVPNWAAADGVVTMYPVAGPQVEVRLDESRDGARICGIAMLEATGGELSVHREVRYLDGSQQALDRAYGWGMNWQAGRK
jgi:tellurite resistance protein TerA